MPHYENVPFEVPSSWEWTTVNAIAKSILYGVSESAKTCGKYRLLRITDIQNNNVQWDTVPYTDFDTNKAESYLLNDGDILFARTGATVGKSYLVQGLKEEAIYASYLIRVQTYDAVLPQYVKFYFESGYYWEQIVQESVGVGQPNVNGTILGNLNIPIPPIHEQDRIVSELSKWMGIIDVIEQGKIDLQTIIKQAKSKILDLAIHGKLVPQDPNDEPASELLKRINPNAEITCDNGQYGKIPFEIPSSWKWCKLKECCHIVGRIGFRGYTKDDLVVDGNGAITLSPSNIINGMMNYDKCTFISWHKYEESPEIQVLCGDILLVKTGSSFGKCALIEHLPKEATINPQFVVLKHISIEKRYLNYVLKSNYARNNYDNFVLGTAIPTFTQVVLGNMQIPLPPLEEQYRIVAKIEELFTLLDNIQKSLEV